LVVLGWIGGCVDVLRDVSMRLRSARLAKLLKLELIPALDVFVPRHRDHPDRLDQAGPTTVWDLTKVRRRTHALVPWLNGFVPGFCVRLRHLRRTGVGYAH